jgi:hypothetical protein
LEQDIDETRGTEMLILPLNMTALLLLPLWAIDLCLLLAAARWFLAQVGGPRSAQVLASLRQVTDPLPDAMGQWLSRRLQRSLPPWVRWAGWFIVLLLSRQILVWILMAAGVVRMAPNAPRPAPSEQHAPARVFHPGSLCVTESEFSLTLPLTPNRGTS